MMTMHLSDDVLLRLAETGDVHPHLEGCGQCREQVESARALLASVRGVTVPEPSPLFWKHLSARVQESVAAETVSHRSWTRFWDPVWRPVLAVGIAVCVLAASWSLGVFMPRASQRVVVRGAQPWVVRPGEREAVDAVDSVGPEGDGGWGVVVEVAGRLDVESAAAAGYALRPGTAGEAVLSLSPSEQREFVRLLQAGIDDPSQ
jgi:hypothetical protein